MIDAAYATPSLHESGIEVEHNSLITKETSDSHTHSHTHTHTHTHSHTHTHTQSLTHTHARARSWLTHTYNTDKY